MKTENRYIKNEIKRKEAEDELRALIEQGKRKIYQTVVWVSRSGMSRIIKNWLVIDGDILNIDSRICELFDHIRLTYDGVKIDGCGMDMGFSIVYDLGRVLYPKGDGKTITGRNGDKTPETDGGYLLKNIWV